jgi:DNA-binding transcriptional MerR regulator
VGERELTIDELAAEVSMTVRNIRAHQSRGLLPKPRLVGRTGYYGPAHVRRLQQIQAMQEQGLNLAAITKVVTDGRLTDIAVAPFTQNDTVPEYRDANELIDRLRLTPDDPVIPRAMQLGLIAVEGDRIRLATPRLMHVAEEFTDQGVPLAAMLDAVMVVRAASAEVAAAFLDVADKHLITQVAVSTGGDPDQIRAAVEHLRVQASEVLTVLFDQAMADAIRTYFDGPAEAEDQ